MATNHSTRLRRMREDGWHYFGSFGIPRDAYDVGHAEVTQWERDDSRDRGEPLSGFVRFTNRETGATLAIEGDVAEDGSWLEVLYRLDPVR